MIYIVNRMAIVIYCKRNRNKYRKKNGKFTDDIGIDERFTED